MDLGLSNKDSVFLHHGQPSQLRGVLDDFWNYLGMGGSKKGFR